MNQPLTKRALVEKGIDALDLSKAGTMPVHHQPAGGVSRVDIAQVIELGKIMAAAGTAVPKHCRGNVGVCVRVAFQAVEWQMSPFSVADASYEVNDRLAYMSQIIHAVVEARAPLQHRLECVYDGEVAYDEVESKDEETGEVFVRRVINHRRSTRVCTVIGRFISGDTREYTTPMLKDIRVKNSPLWAQDPDQQLFYYGSRAWARKWTPDVLLGVYTREELIEHPTLGREEDDAPGLHARLAGSERGEEGHADGHAARELAQIAGAGQTIEHAAAETTAADEGRRPAALAKAKAARPSAKAKQRASDRPKAGAKGKAAEPARTETLVNPADLPTKAEVKRIADRAESVPRGTGGVDAALPRTVAQYEVYARRWIENSADAVGIGQRWADERALRNKIGLTAEDRAPIEDHMRRRVAKLGGEG